LSSNRQRLKHSAGDSYRITFSGSRLTIIGQEALSRATSTSTRVILAISLDSAPTFNHTTDPVQDTCSFTYFKSDKLKFGDHVALVTFVGTEPTKGWKVLVNKAEIEEDRSAVAGVTGESDTNGGYVHNSPFKLSLLLLSPSDSNHFLVSQRER
jgi:hypothetical protein